MCVVRWGGECSRVGFGEGWGIGQGCDIPRVELQYGVRGGCTRSMTELELMGLELGLEGRS